MRNKEGVRGMRRPIKVPYLSNGAVLSKILLANAKLGLVAATGSYIRRSYMYSMACHTTGCSAKQFVFFSLNPLMVGWYTNLAASL